MTGRLTFKECFVIRLRSDSAKARIGREITKLSYSCPFYSGHDDQKMKEPFDKLHGVFINQAFTKQNKQFIYFTCAKALLSRFAFNSYLHYLCCFRRGYVVTWHSFT